MVRVQATCHDNALRKSFWSTLKRGLSHRRQFAAYARTLAVDCERTGKRLRPRADLRHTRPSIRVDFETKPDNMTPKPPAFTLCLPNQNRANCG